MDRGCVFVWFRLCLYVCCMCVVCVLYVCCMCVVRLLYVCMLCVLYVLYVMCSVLHVLYVLCVHVCPMHCVGVGTET